MWISTSDSPSTFDPIAGRILSVIYYSGLKTTGQQLPTLAAVSGLAGGKMKIIGIYTAALLISATAWADLITSPDASFVSVPLTFASTTGSGGGLGTPFWNNYSSDGANMNAGYFLTGSNPAMGLTNYLGAGGNFGSYLSTGGSSPDAPMNFSFLQDGLSVDVTLLYSNAGANMTSTYGTQIGFYNVANPSQKIILFDHGTLYNPNASGGVYNNNLSPQTPFSVNTFANYGLFATTCGYNPNGSIYCETYYSNTGLDSTNEFAHQHFALFQSSVDPELFFVAFEDSRGLNPTEGYGDFNDAIFRIKTDTPPPLTANPEPATFSILGIGLAGLGLLRWRARK